MYIITTFIIIFILVLVAVEVPVIELVKEILPSISGTQQYSESSAFQFWRVLLKKIHNVSVRLSALCLRHIDGTATVTHRRVACHQAHLLAPSLKIIKKGSYLKIMWLWLWPRFQRQIFNTESLVFKLLNSHYEYEIQTEEKHGFKILSDCHCFIFKFGIMWLESFKMLLV